MSGGDAVAWSQEPGGGWSQGPGGGWSGLEPLPDRPAAPGADAARAAREAVRAALAHPAGRAWLRGAIARADAAGAFRPGDALDTVAWREGRRALLRELAAALDCEEI